MQNIAEKGVSPVFRASQGRDPHIYLLHSHFAPPPKQVPGYATGIRSTSFKSTLIVVEKPRPLQGNVQNQIVFAVLQISSRIKLLSRVRQNISPYTAETIYQVMILPVMLYCSNVFVGMTQSKKQRFETFQDRAMRIINGNRKSDVKLPRINHLRNRLCALEVFKCLNGIVPKAFENYFTRNSHKMNTRNNNKSVVIPKVRTETGRKTFSFQGAKVFNNLPNNLQTETSLLRFKASSKDTNLDF